MLKPKIIIPVILATVIIVFFGFTLKKTNPPAPDNKTAINELIKVWPKIEKTISSRPVLGSTAWLPPNYIQFLNADALLVEFENGHIARAGFVKINSIGQALNFTFFERVTNEFPLTADQYQNILRSFNLQNALQAYVKSIFRNGKIIDFTDWMAVPENPFTKTEWQEIKIAVLDVEDKSKGKQVGCDRLVFTNRNIPR